MNIISKNRLTGPPAALLLAALSGAGTLVARRVACLRARLLGGQKAGITGSCEAPRPGTRRGAALRGRLFCWSDFSGSILAVKALLGPNFEILNRLRILY